MTIFRLVLVAFTGMVTAGCQPEVTEEPIVRTVRTMQVGQGGSDIQRTFSGRAQSDSEIDLSFRTNGLIVGFNIKLGQNVTKGDLLAELDTVSARLSYEQAQASLISAKSNLDTQKLALDRARSLYEKGGASLSDYENAKNAHRSAQSTYRSSQRSVDLQLEQIRYAKIFAPEDGVISAVYKDVEENAGVGETVAVLNAGTQMEIEVGLPESFINFVNVGSDVLVAFAALPNIEFGGEVTEVSPSLDRQSTTYPVRIRLVEPSEEIKSGMAASVTFDLDTGEDDAAELLVPATSVGEDSTGRFVFIIVGSSEEEQIASKKYIEVGDLIGDSFEVLSGLELGDFVVTAGVHSLLDGQKVRL